MFKADTNDLHLLADQPLQAQLYRELANRITDQRWQPGLQLPSSRQLAADLNISRNTVNAVYDQLKAEGLLQSQIGKGFFVHPDLHHSLGALETRQLAVAPAATALPVPRMSGIKLLRQAGTDNNQPFTPGLPDLQNFPQRAWNRVLHHHENRLPLKGYDSAQGYLPLRRAVAEYLRTSRGVRCHQDQVIITHGAQQGLALIGELFLNQGDIVLTEDPGYRGARYAMARRDIQLQPIALRSQVLDVAALPAQTEAKLLYCTPTHQYPMGGILDYGQRMQLLQWASHTGTWIVEDDYDSEFHFYNKPIAAMQGLVEKPPVLYLGSFSKTILPALRTGYLVVPENLVDDFVWAKRISSGESPLLHQAVAAEFIDTGQFSRHLRRMRQLYRQKYELLQQLLEQQLLDFVTPVAESAGMHLVLKGDFDDRALSQWLLQHGFGSTALSEHYLGGATKSGLILGFASASPAQTRQCVELLQYWFTHKGQT